MVMPLLALAETTAELPSFFTGDWKSVSGIYQKAGTFYNCDVNEMVFLGSSDQFNFVSGHRHCISQLDPKVSFDEPFQAQQSTFADGKLSMGGAVVGAIQQGRMTLSFSFPDTDGVSETYSMDMIREGRFLTYHEELTKQDVADPLISFVTILQLSESSDSQKSDQLSE